MTVKHERGRDAAEHDGYHGQLELQRGSAVVDQIDGDDHCHWDLDNEDVGIRRGKVLRLCEIKMEAHEIEGKRSAIGMDRNGGHKTLVFPSRRHVLEDMKGAHDQSVSSRLSRGSKLLTTRHPVTLSVTQSSTGSVTRAYTNNPIYSSPLPPRWK